MKHLYRGSFIGASQNPIQRGLHAHILAIFPADMSAASQIPIQSGRHKVSVGFIHIYIHTYACLVFSPTDTGVLHEVPIEAAS